jgi:peptidyl-prolyl cis-trans isomerase C
VAAPVPPRFRRLSREPLVHFLLLGTALFGAHAWLGDGEPAGAAREIVITDRFLEGIEAHHERQTGSVPDGPTREALVDEFVRVEALYREAKRLGLDRGDPIVRRRLVQKMEFLLEGTVSVPEPTDGDLQAHLDAHPERYRHPPRVAFRHVFFSRDRRGERAEDDAEQALPALRSRDDGTPPPDLGDPFLLGLEVPLRPLERIAGSFGRRFAEALGTLPEGTWEGPVASTYGHHLVRVTERNEPRAPALHEVRQRVRVDWVEARREQAMQQAMDDLIAQYEVRHVRDRPVRPAGSPRDPAGDPP